MRELRYYAGRHKIWGKICDRIIAFSRGLAVQINMFANVESAASTTHVLKQTTRSNLQPILIKN